MSINVYCGLMGSGKSYEAVSSVVIPAIKAGRRVVTNIYGMNEALIHAYISENFNSSIESLGSIVLVEDDIISTSNFFYDPSKPDSIVQPGDLVVIDESWRHWGMGMKILPSHMQFFRMHRHYTHPTTGISCDVALMVQSISDLHKTIRNVVALTCKMTKLKRLGLNNSYRVEIFDGSRCRQADKNSYYIKKYDPAIFPLYNSYSGGADSNGVERTIDRRENVLLTPKYIILFSISILSLIFFPYLLYKQFNKMAVSDYNSKPNLKSSSEPALLNQAPNDASFAASLPKVNASTSLRLVGEVVISDKNWVVISDADGRLRFENPAAFVGVGLSRVGSLDGEIVAPWTGSSLSSPQSKGFLQ